MHPKLAAIAAVTGGARMERRKNAFTPAELRTDPYARNTALGAFDVAAAAVYKLLCPEDPEYLRSLVARRHCRDPHPDILEKVTAALAELSVLAFANSDREIASLASRLMAGYM